MKIFCVPIPGLASRGVSSEELMALGNSINKVGSSTYKKMKSAANGLKDFKQKGVICNNFKSMAKKGGEFFSSKYTSKSFYGGVSKNKDKIQDFILNASCKMTKSEREKLTLTMVNSLNGNGNRIKLKNCIDAGRRGIDSEIIGMYEDMNNAFEGNQKIRDVKLYYPITLQNYFNALYDIGEIVNSFGKDVSVVQSDIKKEIMKRIGWRDDFQKGLCLARERVYHHGEQHFKFSIVIDKDLNIFKKNRESRLNNKVVINNVREFDDNFFNNTVIDYGMNDTVKYMSLQDFYKGMKGKSDEVVNSNVESSNVNHVEIEDSNVINGSEKNLDKSDAYSYKLNIPYESGEMSRFSGLNFYEKT